MTEEAFRNIGQVIKHRGTDPLFWRERGDTSFKPFSLEDYQALKSRFVEAVRVIF